MSSAPSFPLLQRYLSRLHEGGAMNTRLWVAADGCAFGRYFNASITSAFQPVRSGYDGRIVGFEAFARSHAVSGQGLCIWRLLDQAASDEESVELDRLCRMLHAMNFFRQSPSTGKDLYLSVHARLLAAVDSSHGIAFSRILEQLQLPREQVVLQLPQVEPQQTWALDYVADNYRRNGFRLALNAATPKEALILIERVPCEAVKIDARSLGNADAVPDVQLLLKLLERCAERASRVILKRVQGEAMRKLVLRLASAHLPLHVQGFEWDLPTAALVTAPGNPAGTTLQPGGASSSTVVDFPRLPKIGVA
ncbi:MAG TPA: EAL domain-containing protein [Noviherbaspirillum sp.]